MHRDNFFDSGGRAGVRPDVRPDVRAARVSSAAPKKKSFDRGGPVWPPRSNVTNDRLRGWSGGALPPQPKILTLTLNLKPSKWPASHFFAIAAHLWQSFIALILVPFQAPRIACTFREVSKDLGNSQQWFKLLRREKSFCKIFAKFFEVFAKFFKVFTSFLRFSRVIRGFRIHSDPLGCIRKQLEASGCFRKILRFLDFESFFNVSGHNF